MICLRETPEGSRESVDEMAARRTDGSKEDMDNVVLYLVTNFGTNKSGSASTTQFTTPSPTSSRPSALNSLEMEHVKRLIAENGYLASRGIEKQEDGLVRYLCSLLSVSHGVQK